jgi:hypothetical protein
VSTIGVQFHGYARQVVLLHVLSDSWKIDLQVDTDLGEDIRPTNARQFKNMGRLDSATINLIVRGAYIVEKTHRLAQH